MGGNVGNKLKPEAKAEAKAQPKAKAKGRPKAKAKGRPKAKQAKSVTPPWD